MEQPPVQAQINECTEIAFLYETNIDFVLRGQGFLENDKISLRNVQDNNQSIPLEHFYCSANELSVYSNPDNRPTARGIFEVVLTSTNGNAVVFPNHRIIICDVQMRILAQPIHPHQGIMFHPRDHHHGVWIVDFKLEFVTQDLLGLMQAHGMNHFTEHNVIMRALQKADFEVREHEIKVSLLDTTSIGNLASAAAAAAVPINSEQTIFIANATKKAESNEFSCRLFPGAEVANSLQKYGYIYELRPFLRRRNDAHDAPHIFCVDDPKITIFSGREIDDIPTILPSSNINPEGTSYIKVNPMKDIPIGAPNQYPWKGKLIDPNHDMQRTEYQLASSKYDYEKTFDLHVVRPENQSPYFEAWLNRWELGLSWWPKRLQLKISYDGGETWSKSSTPFALQKTEPSVTIPTYHPQLQSTHPNINIPEQIRSTIQSVIILGNAVWLIQQGGFAKKTIHGKDLSEWKRVIPVHNRASSIPESFPTSFHTLTAISQTEIVIIGGVTKDGNISGSSFIFDTTTYELSDLGANMISPAYGHSSVFDPIRNRIWVSGNLVRDRSHIIQYLENNTDNHWTWKQCKSNFPVNEGRGLHSSIIKGDSIFFFGGCYQNEAGALVPLASLLKLSMKREKFGATPFFQEIEHPAAQYGHSSFIIDDLIWIVGGIGTQHKRLEGFEQDCYSSEATEQDRVYEYKSIWALIPPNHKLEDEVEYSWENIAQDHQRFLLAIPNQIYAQVHLVKDGAFDFMVGGRESANSHLMESASVSASSVGIETESSMHATGSSSLFSFALVTRKIQPANTTAPAAIGNEIEIHILPPCAPAMSSLLKHSILPISSSQEDQKKWFSDCNESAGDEATELGLVADEGSYAKINIGKGYSRVFIKPTCIVRHFRSYMKFEYDIQSAKDVVARFLSMDSLDDERIKVDFDRILGRENNFKRSRVEKNGHSMSDDENDNNLEASVASGEIEKAQNGACHDRNGLEYALFLILKWFHHPHLVPWENLDVNTLLKMLELSYALKYHRDDENFKSLGIISHIEKALLTKLSIDNVGSILYRSLKFRTSATGIPSMEATAISLLERSAIQYILYHKDRVLNSHEFRNLMKEFPGVLIHLLCEC